MIALIHFFFFAGIQNVIFTGMNNKYEDFDFVFQSFKLHVNRTNIHLFEKFKLFYMRRIVPEILG